MRTRGCVQGLAHDGPCLTPPCPEWSYGKQCLQPRGHEGVHKHAGRGGGEHAWHADAPDAGKRPERCSTAGCVQGSRHDGPCHIPPFDDADDHGAMKEGKLQLELIDLEFVADMARQLQAGLVSPRVADGWRELDPEVYVRKYRGAVLRHLVAASHHFGAVDSQTGATHWAGVAVNAMICGVLEHMALTGE